MNDTSHVNHQWISTSNAFCMAPWTHLHVIPSGNIYQCCLINGHTETLGNVNEISLADAWNAPAIRQSRLDMLNDKFPDSCNWCEVNQSEFGSSFRDDFNRKYSDDLSLVKSTNDNGSLDTMQMRYVDIRFNNLCNLKCRTCGPAFSSKIAVEDGISPALKQLPAEMLDEVFGYLSECEEIYFAGGEPMIMDEHYLILEKLIELGVSPRIRYNSNMTTIKHKHWNVIELWKEFDDIYVQASVDGFGDELKYIRHPTKYNHVINTSLQYLSAACVRIQISTCVSMWNIYSLPDLHKDLIEKKVIKLVEDFRLTPLTHPTWYSAKVLTPELKELITDKLTRHIQDWIIPQMSQHPTNNGHDSYLELWYGLINFMNYSDDSSEWQTHGIKKTLTKDALRNENFKEVFPHLASMAGYIIPVICATDGD